MTLSAIKEQVIHPRCEATPRKFMDFLWLLIVFGVVVFLIAFFWPSPWLLLIAPVFGLAIVLHPLCYITNHKHKNRRFW